MHDTARRGMARAVPHRPVSVRAAAPRRLFDRLSGAVPDRAVGILNAVAFVSLAAALLALVLL